MSETAVRPPEAAAAAPLSAVFATVRGWPDARMALEAIARSARATGAEIIVADGSGNPPPDPSELPIPVRWLSRPGDSVFQLRPAAYRAARAPVVAVTEDHVEVAPDWCHRILAAHAEWPEAAAIGGAMENATDRRALDWGAFLTTQAQHIAPLRRGPTNRIAGAANVSYKRWVIERLETDPRHGLIDFFSLPRAIGDAPLVSDDRIRARHHQSMGLVGTTLAEFHNGRTVAGFRHRRMSRGDWLRLAAIGLLPAYRALRTVRSVRGRQVPPGQALRSFPWLIWFEYVTGAGQLLGYARGPGGSPRKLL